MVEFDCFKNMVYRVKIPLIHNLDDELGEDVDVEEEEVKDDSVIRQPHHATREIQSANRLIRDNMQYKTTYGGMGTQETNGPMDDSNIRLDEFDSNSYRHAPAGRPIVTAPEMIGRRPRQYFNPVVEDPEQEQMDDLLNSPKEEFSTRSFRQDTLQRNCKCAQALLLSSMFKQELESDLNIKCDETWNIPNCIKKLDKANADVNKKCTCGKRGYNYLVIETGDNPKAKSDLEFLQQKVTESVKKAPKPDKLQRLKFIVFGTE